MYGFSVVILADHKTFHAEICDASVRIGKIRANIRRLESCCSIADHLEAICICICICVGLGVSVSPADHTGLYFCYGVPCVGGTDTRQVF